VVEILGAGRKLTGVTDGEGRYSFSGLKPGSYTLNAIQNQYRQIESGDDNTVDVEARSCAVLDLGLRKIGHGTINGHVNRSDNMTAPAGIRVDLIRVGAKGSEKESELLIGDTVETDDNGEYSFQEVTPGLYKVVLNLYNVPTPEDPYLTMYWPGASKETAASPIEISESTTSQQCDFRLSPPLKSTPVKFIVLLPDGTPAKEAHINIETQLDGMAASAGQAITDTSGQFSFGAIEGFEYRVGDIFTAEAWSASKVHFSTADGAEPITIKLVRRDQ
jgi:hypothetical protein